MKMYSKSMATIILFSSSLIASQSFAQNENQERKKFEKQNTHTSKTNQLNRPSSDTIVLRNGSTVIGNIENATGVVQYRTVGQKREKRHEIWTLEVDRIKWDSVVQFRGEDYKVTDDIGKEDQLLKHIQSGRRYRELGLGLISGTVAAGGLVTVISLNSSGDFSDMWRSVPIMAAVPMTLGTIFLTKGLFKERRISRLLQKKY